MKDGNTVDLAHFVHVEALYSSLFLSPLLSVVSRQSQELPPLLAASRK